MLKGVHRYIGLIMVVPLLTWAFTGMFFLVQPGYGSAYERLRLRTYPIEESITLLPLEDWQEMNIMRTVLGHHLLARDASNQWQQYDLPSLSKAAIPEASAVAELLNDAIAHDASRYGAIEEITVSAPRFSAITTTGIELTLDWNSMQLNQYGSDTQFIDRLYRLHYLQWTPDERLNKLLAGVALIGLIALSVVGLQLLMSSSRTDR